MAHLSNDAALLKAFESFKNSNIELWVIGPFDDIKNDPYFYKLINQKYEKQ
jgi:hypothetical protein